MVFVRYMSQFSFMQLRFLAFALALLIYAGFGSPTPDVLGWVEISVGVLLLCGIGVDGLRFAVFPAKNGLFWRQTGQGLLVYGLVAGFVMAVMGGNDFRLIVRDVIPFLFLMMPLFLYPFAREQNAHWIAVLMCAVGVIFSLRIWLQLDADALYYLGNSPLVLFAALMGIAFGVERISKGLSVRHFAIAAVFFVVAAIALLPMVVTLQRASLGYAGLFSVVILLLQFRRYPRRVLFVSLVFVIPVLSYVFVQADVVWMALQEKTSLYGANMRVQEWMAVWSVITGSPLTFLFGQGFGAVFESPAVADIPVSFTHSLLSSMLLKIGVFGLLACVVYLVALAREGFKVLNAVPMIGFALAGPVVIDVFFYAAYKSLDFGLILALVVIYSAQVQRFVANPDENG